MRGIPFSTEQTQLKERLASVFHSSTYSRFEPRPLNFDVRIHRRHTKRAMKTGIITVPTETVGEQFLRDYGDRTQARMDTFDTIYFERGRHAPNRRVLKAIRETPYSSPRIGSQSNGSTVSIERLQFGWYCTDEQYSVEWEKKFDSRAYAKLVYDEQRRQFQLTVQSPTSTMGMTVRHTQVYWAAASPDQSGEPSIFFYLHYPPSFETSLPDLEYIDDEDLVGLGFGRMSLRAVDVLELFGDHKRIRKRITAFEETHQPIAPYTSLAIRLVCKSVYDIATFRHFCRTARLPVDASPPPVVHRGLFSSTVREEYRAWAASLSFPVAFQVEAILTQWLTHIREIVRVIRPVVDSVVSRLGAPAASLLLADLRTRLEARVWYGDGVEVDENTTRTLLATALRQLRTRQPMPHADLFHCNHLYITTTSLILEGPVVERSNRIIRQYWDNRDSFLRVHFMDDNRLAYRFDSEIDLKELVERRVKRFLLDGVTVAGQHFEFLGYSQSALKSHSVWFVRPFPGSDGRTVNAAIIIAGLGNFADNSYDPRLIYCPARYAARISQAFSATESSIMIAVEDMEIVDDIMDATGTYSFTDGNGTMSLQVARNVAADQRSKTRVRRAWRMHDGEIPRVMQVRIAGSKGMLHVDHRLEGHKIRLPKSMVKFNAPSNRMEIAQLFEEPSPFNLNRPMIMLLEGLGVRYEVFQRLQDSEVRATHALTESLANSGWLLDKYGLGNSFRLSSTILHLHRLGVPLASFTGNTFWSRMLTFAVNHVLRELKYHARIPVPGGWTLVGIADIHGQLREGEIYARVVTQDGHETYLEGPALVTRSPAIHPGDIQVLRAIGRPPEGSDLALGELKNCIVFPTRGASRRHSSRPENNLSCVTGSRPLPSYFGGGDLDGDMYNVTTVPHDLLPPTSNLRSPASYSAAKRKYLKRPSQMKDVADFIGEFIISDVRAVASIASTRSTKHCDRMSASLLLLG